MTEEKLRKRLVDKLNEVCHAGAPILVNFVDDEIDWDNIITVIFDELDVIVKEEDDAVQRQTETPVLGTEECTDKD